MTAPTNAKFAASHEWILSGESTSPVGISHHAQAELGEVVYIELPTVGRQVKAGESVAVIESVKAASDIYAPVDGEIVEVNSAAASDPALVNTSPYQDGWLFKIKVADASQLSALMDEPTYLAHVG